MKVPSLSPARYIDNKADFEKLIQQLKTYKSIAFDTESNSMYAYRGQTCLIQLTANKEDVVIDPLAIDDISLLGEIFADHNIEKIFHAAEYDLICLKRDFDFDVHNVFDTMAAARVCGYNRVGLSNLLELLLDIKHPKTHQTDDWAQRPLPDDYIRYAQMDTHFLHQLRDLLYEELLELGRVEETYEFFVDVTTFDVKPSEFDPDGFWGLGRPHTLNRQQMAVLREVYILRDELAKMYDYPTHRLISNKALVTIAKTLPNHRKKLFDIRGLPSWIVKQNGDEIIEAIFHGRTSRLPKRPPRQHPPPPDVVERYTALHAWRKNRALARGIESDVIISKQTLWEIARIKPQTVDELVGLHGIGEWRLQHYGNDLIHVVNHSQLEP
jgi:ribonuclease D